MSLGRFLTIVSVLLCLNVISQDLMYKWENSPVVGLVPWAYHTISDLEEDPDGNYVVCGYFRLDVNFEPLDPDFDANFDGYICSYVAKLSDSGERIWVKTVTFYDPDLVTYGSDRVLFRSLGVDDSGNIFVGGQYHGPIILNDPNFPDPIEGGEEDLILIKYDSDGNVLWYEAKGSDNQDNITEITIHDGHLYIGGSFGTGGTLGFEDPLPPPLPNITRDGCFVRKMTLDGDILWSSTSYCIRARLNGIEFMSDGNPVITYTFQWSSNYLSILDAMNIYPNPLGVEYLPHDNVPFTGGSKGDIIIAKLSDVDGSAQWLSDISGNEKEEVLDLQIDSQDNVYICGFHSDSCDFKTGPELIEQHANGGEDIFLAKFNSLGEYQWHKSAGGLWGANYTNYLTWYQDRRILNMNNFPVQEEVAIGLGIDELDNLYISGNFVDEIDFGGADGQLLSVTPGEQQPFVAKYSSEGDFQWAHPLLSQGGGISGGLHVLEENTFITWSNGKFNCDIDPSANEHIVDMFNDIGLFVVKYSDQVCIGDLNGDNSIDSADLLNVLGAFNTLCEFEQPCPSDFNDDGIVNAVDLLTFLSQIGNAPCP